MSIVADGWTPEDSEHAPLLDGGRESAISNLDSGIESSGFDQFGPDEFDSEESSYY